MSLPRIPRDSADRVVNDALRRMGMDTAGKVSDRYITVTSENVRDLCARVRDLKKRSDEEIIIDMDLAVGMDTGPALSEAVAGIKDDVLSGGFRFMGSKSALRLSGMILGRPLTGPERIQIEIINECTIGCSY